MVKFIFVTLINNEKELVNLSKIRSIRPNKNGSGSTIVYDFTDTITVKETIEQLDKLINGEQPSNQTVI